MMMVFPSGFPFIVDYMDPLEQLLREWRYFYHPDIKPPNFLPIPGGKRHTEMLFAQFNQLIDSRDVSAQLREHRLRAANLWELLAFGPQLRTTYHPLFSMPMLALGQVRIPAPGIHE